MMAHFADFTGKLSHGVYKMAPNNFNLAWSADKVGAMRNQVYVMGRFDLNPGEAFVVDVSDGGAEYFTVPLSNIWGTTLDIVDRTGSLNKAQSVPNEDGTYTYVISPTDPGVANWIDSDGLNEGILTLRMAEFGGDGPKEDLGARGRVVKLDDLDTEVPDAAPGVRRRSGRPNSPIAARRTCAACPKGRTDMGRWLITGCSTGIGREIARAALEAGHSVVVTARRTETVADFADDFGDRAVVVALDVTDKDQIASAVQAADDAFGGIDVLVNNAGYGYLSAVEEGEDDEVRKLFDTNYFGVVDTIKAVLPQMRARQSGHIINISSMTGLVANPPNAYYSSTKFALEALTEALAQEVGPLGIKVTAIEPGAFRTDWAARSMWESSTPIGDYDENVGARKTMIKEFANHLPGDPRKVAEAVLMVTTLDEPPLRLLLGRDVLKAVRDKLAAFSASIDEWEAVTKDVNFPKDATDDDGQPRRPGRVHHRRRTRYGPGARRQARRRGRRHHRPRRLRRVRLHRLSRRDRRGPGRDGEAGRGPGPPDPGAAGRRS